MMDGGFSLFERLRANVGSFKFNPVGLVSRIHYRVRNQNFFFRNVASDISGGVSSQR
jgi:hypothetical protein